MSLRKERRRWRTAEVKRRKRERRGFGVGKSVRGSEDEKELEEVWRQGENESRFKCFMIIFHTLTCFFHKLFHTYHKMKQCERVMFCETGSLVKQIEEREKIISRGMREYNTVSRSVKLRNLELFQKWYW